MADAITIEPCNPPGSIRTAIDVDLLAEPNPTRFCGMCATDLAGVTLGQNCPKCRYKLGWFQLLAVGGLSASPRSEAALAKYIRDYKARQAADDGFDGPDDGGY